MNDHYPDPEPGPGPSPGPTYPPTATGVPRFRESTGGQPPLTDPLFPTAEPPSQASSTAGASQRATGTSSSQGSSPDATPPPAPAGQQLTNLIANGVAALSELVSIFARRRFGIDVAMHPSEALTLARPVSRLIARRFNVSGDLNDAADATEGATGLLSFAKRLAFSVPVDTTARVNVAPAQAHQPAGTVLHGYGAPPAPATHPQAFAPPQRPPAQGYVGPDGKPVVGSGPAKAAFLAGFEDE